MVTGGVDAAVVLAPSTVEEAAGMIQRVSLRDQPLAPAGTNSRSRWVPTPDAANQPISSLHLNRIVEYDAADLTVTVQAGTRLRDLQAVLRQQGQFLPVDSEDGTVGGAIAGAITGPSVLGYGALRDRLLRVRAITAGGETTTTGSKVVKSVAGFDLGKVYCGSFGTLVFVVEATFKLSPLPPEMSQIAFCGRLDDIRTWLTQILASPFRPLTLQVLSSSATTDVGGTALAEGELLAVARVGGRAKALKRQTHELAVLARLAALRQRDVDDQIQQRLETLTNHQPCAAMLRVKPSELLGALTMTTDAHTSAFCEFGSNRLVIWAQTGDLATLPDQLWHTLPDQGQSLLERGPGLVTWRRRLTPEASSLVRRIKEALDPDDIFQRGLLPRLLGE